MSMRGREVPHRGKKRVFIADTKMYKINHLKSCHKNLRLVATRRNSNRFLKVILNRITLLHSTSNPRLKSY